MTPNEMSLDQCRDWLAEHTPRMERGEGHWCMDRTAHVMHPMHRIFAPGTLGLGHIFWYASKDQHPYPPTLDGAAGAMGGLLWYRNGFGWRSRVPNRRHDIRVPDTGNPIHDLYRLAVACRQAMKGTP